MRRGRSKHYSDGGGRGTVCQISITVFTEFTDLNRLLGNRFFILPRHLFLSPKSSVSFGSEVSFSMSLYEGWLCKWDISPPFRILTNKCQLSVVLGSTWSHKTVRVFIATTEEVRSLLQPLSILSQSLGPPGQIQSHRDADFLRDSAKREPALDSDSKMEIVFC